MQHTPAVTFMAGIATGVTESVLVVTPSEVCKIRLQAQRGMWGGEARCNGAIQMASKIVAEEGIGALYKGVVPTMLRQSCNQAMNFTFYGIFKNKMRAYKQRVSKSVHLCYHHCLL